MEFIFDVEKMIYGGAGLGRLGGKVVFVPFTVPGDRVKVEIHQEKRDFIEARLLEIISPSTFRTQPFCPLFGRCGGCHYQHIAYREQIRLKEEILQEFLSRKLMAKNFDFLPMIPSPRDRSYRIRAQFKVGTWEGEKVLGFYATHSHRVIPIEACPLLHILAQELLQTLQAWWNQEKGPFSIQGIDIQVSPDEGRGVVAIKAKGKGPFSSLEQLAKRSTLLKGIAWEGNPPWTWGDVTLLYQGVADGTDPPIRYQAHYRSFIQVNPDQNRNLIHTLMQWAELTGRERVLDLYCGAGNLSLPLARRSSRLWGIDRDEGAVASARENAKRNGLAHADFMAATARGGLLRLKEEIPRLDVAVMDPPRAGAQEILPLLASLRPERIFYISCNPSTLIRDLAKLEGMGYDMKRIRGLDMFPQTYHMEAIAELQRRDSKAEVCGFGENRRKERGSVNDHLGDWRGWIHRFPFGGSTFEGRPSGDGLGQFR